MTVLRKLLVQDGRKGRRASPGGGGVPISPRNKAATPLRRGGRYGHSGTGRGVPGDGRRRQVRDASMEARRPVDLSKGCRTAPLRARKEGELGGQPDRHPLSRGITRPGGHKEGARLGSARLGYLL